VNLSSGLDEERRNKSKTKPVVHGVNSHWLLTIDPRKIIIPILLLLHVEIGLILNKFNEEVMAYGYTTQGQGVTHRIGRNPSKVPGR
jgi:hypothetical protein